MHHGARLIGLCVKFLYLQHVTGQMNFFASSNGAIAFENDLSQACLTAMNTTLQCPSQFTTYPNSDFSGPFSNAELDAFCSPACRSSVAEYKSAVSSSCDHSKPIFDNVPATFVIDRMAAYQNRTCLEDPNGNYCSSE